MNSQTNVYAVYLPGSTKPDYIGAHVAQPAEKCGNTAWKYGNMTYVGNGSWMDNEGKLFISKSKRAVAWGRKLASLSNSERLSIRVEVLSTVDADDAGSAQRKFRKQFKPPFNYVKPPKTKADKSKVNAYMRDYLPIYLHNHAEKAEAKKKADRERMRRKREEARKTKEGKVTV